MDQKSHILALYGDKKEILLHKYKSILLLYV